jgi:hypothetical protein
VVVDAASIEPVSTPNSLLAGNLAREFAGQYFSLRSGACDGENIPKIPDATANFEEMTVNDKRWRRIEARIPRMMH